MLSRALELTFIYRIIINVEFFLDTNIVELFTVDSNKNLSNIFSVYREITSNRETMLIV